MIDDDRVAVAARRDRSELIADETALQSSKASTAAAANPPATVTRRAGLTAANRMGAASKAATANVTPPTKAELSKPATTIRTRVRNRAALGRCAKWTISTIAATTHDADIRCCGTQADWNNQPAKPLGDAMNGSSEKLPKKKLSVVRSDAAAARATTRIAAPDRSLSQTATAIIKVERGESGEPGQADIGFPAADMQRQRQLRRAEVPEVIIGQPPGRTHGTERGAEHRIDRRQALPRHRVDDGDLGVIEYRVRKMHAGGGKFRNDRARRHQSENRGRRISP